MNAYSLFTMGAMQLDGRKNHAKWSGKLTSAAPMLARLHTQYTGWWFGTCFICPYIGNFIIPTDFQKFQRVETTNQVYVCILFPARSSINSGETDWMGTECTTDLF